MNDIREQIEQLRMQAGISGYHSLMASAADTMERLLAVYEAVNAAIQDELEQNRDLHDLTPLWAGVDEAIAAVQLGQSDG